MRLQYYRVVKGKVRGLGARQDKKIFCPPQVYNTVSAGKVRSFPERVHRFHSQDPLAGKLYVLCLAIMYLYYLLLCYLQPKEVGTSVVWWHACREGFIVNFRL